MKRKTMIRRAALTLALCFCLTAPVFADGADEGAYTGAFEEFAQLEGLEGAFVTELPDEADALVMLGSRQLRQGDTLTANELQYLTVQPVNGWTGEAKLCLLPVCGGTLGDEAVLTMHVVGSTEGPSAPDRELEVYRGIPVSDNLRASGEGTLTFRLKDAPQKGDVELEENGAFTYTPRGELVGEDRFTFTVTDAAGRESEPATVRVTIRRPMDRRTFADLDRDRQVPALWLREQGVIDCGEEDGRLCFYPDRTLSRAAFLTMLMELRGMAPEVGLRSGGFADEAEAPAALRPYLAAALRMGIVRGTASPRGLLFMPNEPITQEEAVQMTLRVLERTGSAQTAQPEASTLPAWAESVTVFWQTADPERPVGDGPLTREQAAQLLYEAARQP